MIKKTPRSYIELSKNNLIHNIKQFKEFAKKGTKFSVAIKGNAYGHGQNEIAKTLEPHVEYFQIDSFEELKLLRKVTKKEAFLFGYVEKDDLQEAIKLGCILTIFSIKQLNELNKITQKLKTKQEIQIPFDAYLGREGFLLKELPEFFTELKKYKYIRLTGIYAHFANIEDTHPTEQSFGGVRKLNHAQKQINEYERCLKLAEEFGFNRTSIQTHISASSGILAYEKDKGIHPLVRLGISVYGMWPSEYLKSIYKNTKFIIKPVLSWKTKVAQVKILPKGSTIGYGLTYKTKRETKIAIIPQGYADGLDRGFSNNGFVLIKGTKCEILGRVMMNMSAVNVSHLKNVQIEDEVVILGKQGNEEITAEEMAGRIDTINYEIITRINPLLPRIVV